MKKVVLIIWIAVVGFFLSIAPQAEALSCEPPQPVKQEMERSSIVFKGKAIQIKNGGLTVFQVEVAWKGVKGPIVEIYDNGWDPFKKNTEYLVFGSEKDGERRMNLCGRTGQWDKAREEAMKETDIQPTVFQKEATVKERSEQSRLQIGTIILAVLLISLISMLCIVMWRRKIRRTD